MSKPPGPEHRGTILLEEAEVLAREAHPGAQWVMRLRAPRIAARAEPGSFVHVTCRPLLPMRRPMSVMRRDAGEGWLDILFKDVGFGTRLLAGRGPGERLSVLGPVGRPFVPDPARPRALLVGGGVGIPPMVFLAEHLRAAPVRPLVLMGSEVPFPFDTPPSALPVPGVSADVDAALGLAEAWGIPSRLASNRGYPGCFPGHVTELARAVLEALDARERAATAVYGCGPTPMLRALAALAEEYAVPCAVSLEEYMACAVGGCAGCAVRVRVPGGTAMRRVCVDGPVFDSRAVVWG